MKKLHLGFILIVFMVCFAACTKNEYYLIENQEQEDKSTYTIMMYGCGGGSLDKEMILNIQEALLAGSTDRVNFTGQVKFSSRFQQTEEFNGTQRFIIEPTNGNWYTPIEVLDEKLELFNPQNLTDFINWSKEQCPADEYILLLWNHGSAWSPKFDAPQSRAIVHDDIFKQRAITLDELVKGIKDSGTKMKMIYFDACLMGMLEVLTGIRECAEYALCASHVTPSMGGDYNSLIYHLDNSTCFEKAMDEYCSETISHWNNDGLPFDLKLVNLDKMDQLLKDVGVLSSYLNDVAQISSEFIADRENGVKVNPYDNNTLIADTFEYAINNCYNYFWLYKDGVAEYPYYDIHMLAELLASGPTNSYSARFVDISSRLNRSLKEAIVCKHNTTIANGWDFTMGVLIVNKDIWVKGRYNTTYNGLMFDQQTNWGKWLSINPINPKGNPNAQTIINSNPGNEGDEEDEEEEDEIPLDEEINQLLKLIGKL